jgi:hypothetical protein
MSGSAFRRECEPTLWQGIAVLSTGTVFSKEGGFQQPRLISTGSLKNYCVYRMAHVGDCPLGCFNPDSADLRLPNLGRG